MPVLRWDVEHLSRMENVLHTGGTREEGKLEQVRILHINLWSRAKAGTGTSKHIRTAGISEPVTRYHKTGLTPRLRGKRK